MQIKNYEDAVKYLESFIGKIIFKITPDYLRKHDPLERMRILLGLLDNPQEKFRSILVGGTSGKGSTAYLISHILKTAGCKVGLTISPHLQKVNERLQINGEQISDSRFASLVSSLVRSIELMRTMRVGAPSYFEILVAMAFVYFAREKVNIAVVEVGMGGEFDATNTLYPLIAVLTNVGLDHTSILGNTVEKIARTKAGIIKKNQESRIMNQGKNSVSSIIHDSQFMIQPIMVTGVRQRSVVKIVEERCEKVGGKLLRLGKDFDESIIKNYKLSLLGDYQAENASLAVETVSLLEDFGFKVSEKDIEKALNTAFFPGRFEIVRGPVKSNPSRQCSFHCALSGRPSSFATPLIILDGAHNPVKMREFLKSLRKIFPAQKKIFIVGFKFDKDIRKMLKQIVKVADEIIVTEFKAKTDIALHASADTKSIKHKLLSIKRDTKACIEVDSKKALEKALTIQQRNNSAIIIVTGSLYLVGEVRSLVCPN